MHSSNKKIILAMTAIILLISVFGLIYIFTSSEITHDVNKMITNAKKLYNNGEFDKAYYQMLVYTQENPNDKEGWIILGDYALEKDDSEQAFECYRKASACEECNKNQLGESDKQKYFERFSSIEAVEIYPSAKQTKDMTLTFTSDNLTPAKSVVGQIVTNEMTLSDNEDYLTTEWFPVDESKNYVYITGNINCAQWQFIDDTGSYYKHIDESDFKNARFHGFENKTHSTAKIPEGAVSARVTYYDKSITTNVQADDKIYIGYGKALTGYSNFTTQTFNIPDLTENQYIEYKESKWYLIDGNNKTELNLPAISAKVNATVSISGSLCGMVNLNFKPMDEIKSDKSLQYGIKYSTKTAIASCERLGSALGMNFDYTVDDEWYYGTGNDFDNAYPWSEMKLCNVKVNDKGEEKITLEGEEKFATDGSNGNVMVRIPKFYTKRVVKDGYENIWISGKKHKGYTLEPVFIDENGEEKDYVYMSAYLGALQDEKIISTSNTYPAVQLEYGKMLDYAQNNGEGFDELNFLMVSALQKLFIIETGTIDSSEIFAGDTYMYYQYDTNDYETSGYACEDAKKSNVIKIYNNYNTIKISEGSSITLFDGWKKYKNNNGSQREVLEVKTSEKYMEITFDGDPIDISKHKTLISNIPAKTGKTDSIKYCSGTPKGTLGKHSFKYRNIENLFGSSLIMLDDDAYVQDGYFYYETADGNLNYVDYEVAEQNTDLSSYEKVNTTACIKEMGFDKDNPTVMLPTVVGKGASTYGYYGDLWMYTNNDDPRYIMYGGADDNERVAGLFQMRVAISNYQSKLGFFSSRIMYS